MDEERLKVLFAQKNFDICIEFLAKMIEKYGNKIDMDDILEEK